MLKKKRSLPLSTRNRRSLVQWTSHPLTSPSLQWWSSRSSSTRTIAQSNWWSECLRSSTRPWTTERSVRESTRTKLENHRSVDQSRWFDLFSSSCLFLPACGGDGTVGWVLSALDTSQMQYMDFVSVGVIPLGTGNDMARFLGWGVGYHGESLAPVIQSLAVSETRLLDRWLIDVKPTAQSGAAELKVIEHLKSESFDGKLRVI